MQFTLGPTTVTKELILNRVSEETLMEHVKSCPDCQKEQEVMNRVSDLLKEVRPYYKEKRRNITKLKAACAVFAILLSGTTLGVINFNTDISDTIKYGTTLSAEDYGFPVDSYGFLMVE